MRFDFDESLRSPIFADPEGPARRALDELREREHALGLPPVPGIERLPSLGTLALCTPGPAVVLAPVFPDGRVPSTFVVEDTETALGFWWPIVWTVETASIVPSDGGEIALIEGTPQIPFYDRDDLWHALIPQAVCGREITLVVG